jgi:hypothetical protein
MTHLAPSFLPGHAWWKVNDDNLPRGLYCWLEGPLKGRVARLDPRTFKRAKGES